ncbi:MAG: phosphoribosylformylglycinamidine synthase subunit PurS, partial [Actinobacteria bacterium]|jgi:phosphoribosylformylglycinamidine synthase|nr:phosphoribosylformylglycinamidine synthase subunit PurS [Actinomycetota bacterium]
LGYQGVEGVTVGKTIRFTLEAETLTEAQTMAEELCESFLTNPVIEDAEVTVEEAS